MNSAFATALLDPARPVPKDVVNPDGSPAAKRFAVYRNNVAVGLSDALELSFPVIRQLLGADFFRAMAGVFLRRYPPQSPLMMFYGAALPGFLAGFPPVAHLPYLPDLARLELAIRHAYHAADSTPMDTAILGGMDPNALIRSIPHFAPAVQLLHSEWPIHAIWLVNKNPRAPKPVAGPQAVLVTRAGFDPTLHPLDPITAQVVRLLLAGNSFSAALAAAPPDFDLAGVLTLLLAQGAMTGLT